MKQKSIDISPNITSLQGNVAIPHHLKTLPVEISESRPLTLHTAMHDSHYVLSPFGGFSSGIARPPSSDGDLLRKKTGTGNLPIFESCIKKKSRPSSGTRPLSASAHRWKFVTEDVQSKTSIRLSTPPIRQLQLEAVGGHSGAKSGQALIFTIPEFHHLRKDSELSDRKGAKKHFKAVEVLRRPMTAPRAAEQFALQEPPSVLLEQPDTIDSALDERRRQRGLISPKVAGGSTSPGAKYNTFLSSWWKQHDEKEMRQQQHQRECWLAQIIGDFPSTDGKDPLDDVSSSKKQGGTHEDSHNHWNSASGKGSLDQSAAKNSTIKADAAGSDGTSKLMQIKSSQLENTGGGLTKQRERSQIFHRRQQKRWNALTNTFQHVLENAAEEFDYKPEEKEGLLILNEAFREQKLQQMYHKYHPLSDATVIDKEQENELQRRYHRQIQTQLAAFDTVRGAA